MTVKTKIITLNIILVFTIGTLPVPVSAFGSPATHTQFINSTSINDLTEGEHQNILGVLYLNDSLALKIGRQPVGNSNFVTPMSNYVTEFQIAANYGAVGLLAHNYLAGRYFFKILPGQEIKLVYRDNLIERFVVTRIQKYQALSPNSPSSDFIDLATGEFVSASQLFRKMYKNQSGNLVLQTCIYADENPTWGRLFIIAEPVA